MYRQAAIELGCEIAAIKAVATVESRGSGFLPDGQPKILFEAHVFYEQLELHGLDPKQLMRDPTNRGLIAERYGQVRYGTESEQHRKLQRAVKIHRDAALASCSWGAFQVMAYQWKDLGYASLQDFINDAFEGADGHLRMFIAFIKYKKLQKYLIAKDWAGFALRYNGSAYKKNNYDTRMADAYAKLSK